MWAGLGRKLHPNFPPTSPQLHKLSKVIQTSKTVCNIYVSSQNDLAPRPERPKRFIMFKVPLKSAWPPRPERPRRRRQNFLILKPSERKSATGSTRGGAEQNPEHAESVLARHRCVPKIASQEAINPENILQRSTNRMVLREALGGCRAES